MSITKYTNFERINQKLDNEGKLLQDKDSIIVTKSEIEDSDFGECKYDVMEVSVYDINNNLLPQKSGNNVAYIKTGDIKHYLYNITNNRGVKEVAIDVEKLLEHLGFTNGILRVNINFVRNKVGEDDESRRIWIQEVSPSRTEIRVLPLKVSNPVVSEQTATEFSNLQNLSKDFKYYRKDIMNSLYSFQNTFLDTITTSLESKYGSDFFNILRKDFGLRDFEDIKKHIYDDFKKSVDNYLNNKYYWINESNFGKQSQIRFEDCEHYDFKIIVSEMENILRRCIEVNTSFLKRRDFNVKETPKNFKPVELVNEIQDTADFYQPPIKTANVIYSPNDVEVKPTDPPPTIVSEQPNDVMVIPPKVVVTNIKPTFTYSIKNTSSLRSIIFTFTDASGATVQKVVSAGGTITICAQEDSVSANQTKGIVSSKSNTINVGEISDESIPNVEYIITKLSQCNTVDIGEGAPIQLSSISLPPKGNSPVVDINPGGGVTREEAAQSTNQIITPRGTAISTATAAGMSEGSNALQNVTTTDVRQTSITGPTID